MKIMLEEEMGPWHRPAVAAKKASTINTTTNMTIATKKPAPAIKLKELLAAKERLEELKQQQAVAREEELRIREYLARKLHDGVEGSKTITVEGVKCTITRNLTRTIGVDEAEKLSKEHSDLALAVLRWKAEVRVGEYKKHADVLDDYIVTKAGPPSVEFK